MTPVDVLALIETPCTKLCTRDGRRWVVKRRLKILADRADGDSILTWAYDALVILARDHDFFLSQREAPGRQRTGPEPARRWHHLELGHDAGGRRWFLVSDGYRAPVHAGAGLELQVSDRAIPVGFEVGPDFEPVLYMRLGEDRETAGDVWISAPRLRCVAEDGWHGVRVRFADRRRR